MKIFNNLKSACLLVLLIVFTALEANAQRPVRVSFQVFYDELQPYGQWFDDPEYGYIWVPDDGPDFYPYASEGHWVITEYGNTWVSDYPWGWAPFHYGRWDYDDYYGWFWVPDYEWAPAWVSWRTGGGYYGWAPLAPGVNITIVYNHWIFIPQRYIFSPQIHRYRVSRFHIENVYKRSRLLKRYYDRNNRRYMDGPRIYDIERATRSRVVIHRIDDMSRPGRSEIDQSKVKIYRPEVNKEDRNTSRPSRIIENKSNRETKRETTNDSRPSRPERVTPDRTERSVEENKPARQERPSRQRVEERTQPKERTTDKNREETKERPQRQKRQRVAPENRNEQRRSEGRSEHKSSERPSSGGSRPKRI